MLVLYLTFIDEPKHMKDMSEKDNLQEAEGVQESTTPQSEVTENQTSENANTLETAETPNTETNEVVDEALEEIEASNAEDAEDENNSKRHEIEEKDYHSMSMEDLVKRIGRSGRQ